MMKQNTSNSFKIVASLCDTCDCGCPTILESSDGESMVIIGTHDENILTDEVIMKKTSAGETAVVIPKSILLQAMKIMSDKN